MTNETKTARRTLAEELLAQHETLKSLSDHVRGLQIEVGRLKQRLEDLRNSGDLRAPLPNTKATEYFIGGNPPQCAGPAPEGGSRKDRPLFGYEGSDYANQCGHCGEPASEHGCPEVK